MRVEINYKKKYCKNHKHMDTKQYAAKQSTGHWKSQKENKKKYLETNENGHDGPKSMGLSKSISKREVYSDKSRPQKTRKISNTTLNTE